MNFRNPFDPAAPAAVPTMFGNAATEFALYMAANLAIFSLDAVEVQRRLGRFLRPHRRRLPRRHAGRIPERDPPDSKAAFKEHWRAKAVSVGDPGRGDDGWRVKWRW